MNERNKRFVSAAILFLLLLWMTDALWAQEAAAPAAAAGKGESITLWHRLVQGGIVMIPLGICSVTVLALSLQLLMSLRLSVAMPPAASAQLKQLIAQGTYDQAIQVCQSSPSILTRIIAGGLTRLSRGREAVEYALEEHAAREASRLRALNSYLSVIAVISPMLGLTGTVIGMIKAFQTLSQAGADPSRLSGAIGEVLVATATGLFVAVPAFIAYFFIRNRIIQVTLSVENKINELVEDIPYEAIAGGAIAAAEPSAALPPMAPVGAPTAMPVPQTANVPAAAAAGNPSGSGPRVRAAVAPAVMINCPNCNAQIPERSPKCSACGAALEWD